MTLRPLGRAHLERRGKLNTNFADLLIALLDARKAGEERRDIRERSMRGKNTKAKAGKIIASRPPYGYTYIQNGNDKDVTLAIDKKTARIVQLIYQWYVIGDENRRTLAAFAIATRLSEMRVPTPGELQTNRMVYRRKRPAGVWNVPTVLSILTEEAYAGTWHFNETEQATRRVRPQDEQIRITVPAIIDRETWERAQAQRKRN